MTSYSNLTRPVAKKKLGLSSRFYWVVLVAAVLMIGLQAIPLLRGQGPTEADAAATQQETSAADAATPTGEIPAAQPAAPTQEPQASTKAASSSPAIRTEPVMIAVTLETPSTTRLTSAAPDETPATSPKSLPSPDATTASATPATSETTYSQLLGLSEDADDHLSSADSSDAKPPESAAAPIALARASIVQPTAPPPSKPPGAEIAEARPKPTVWTGVIRLLSAVTKVDLTAPGRAASDNPLGEAPPPVDPLVTDEAPPAATPEDEETTAAEETARTGEHPDLSAAVSPPAATELTSPSQQPLVLINPLESRGTIYFLVNGEVASLRPGETQTLRPEQVRIRFHRGGNFGEAEVVLNEGSHQFRATRQGWTLTP